MPAALPASGGFLTVNARWFLSLAALGAMAAAGCGEGPSARFVVSERTKKLTPTARTAVEGELQKGFGDPNHLVAWPKLPVDFGDFQGVVEAAPQKLTDAFNVTLSQKPKSVVAYKPEQFTGAALVWTSGENSGDDLVAQVKGKDVPINFQVSGFDPKTSELKVRVLPPEAAGALAPPKKGDKFAVLGPVLQHGRKLYMQNCEHCHGVSGDGAGPTAEYFDIKPRDYRQGLFKFTSTRNMDKARRDDLYRTVRYGIPGTYMPSFLLFKDDELGAIVEYIRWLSMRGEFEQKVDIEFEAEQYTTDAIAQRRKGGEDQAKIDSALNTFITNDLPRISSDKSDDLVTAWNTAEQPDALIVPKKSRTPDSPESRERGRKLFVSDVAKCAQCHGPAGRGDGPQTEDYQLIPGSTKKFKEPGLFDAWDHPIKPRDLTSGIYRGGRRPLDIYRRIYSGIKGTPMPPFGSALKDEEIWDLVNYAMSLPYQKGSASPEPPQQNKIAATEAAHRAAEGN
jgi:mono/diheme cytochrome c family protein